MSSIIDDLTNFNSQCKKHNLRQLNKISTLTEENESLREKVEKSKITIDRLTSEKSTLVKGLFNLLINLLFNLLWV